MKASKAKAIVCTTQNEVPKKITAALKASNMTAKLWCVQKDADGFENLTTAMKEASEELDRVQTKVTDPMMLYFTSGTTGYPLQYRHS